MKTENRTKPAEITLYEQTFNRLTFIKLGDKSENPNLYVYDGRGYKFVHYPETEAILKEPNNKRFDAIILFGVWDDADEKWFVFFSTDCFDPPLYLVNGRSFEDAYESFTDEFIDAIKVDDLQHECELEAKDECKKNGENWDELSEETKALRLNIAENILSDKGIVSRNPSGQPYWAESIQGFEVSLVKAEKV